MLRLFGERLSVDQQVAVIQSRQRFANRTGAAPGQRHLQLRIRNRKPACEAIATASATAVVARPRRTLDDNRHLLRPCRIAENGLDFFGRPLRVRLALPEVRRRETSDSRTAHGGSHPPRAHQPQTSLAVSTTNDSFFFSSSTVTGLPMKLLAKPHCGLRHS